MQGYDVNQFIAFPLPPFSRLPPAPTVLHIPLWFPSVSLHTCWSKVS